LTIKRKDFKRFLDESEWRVCRDRDRAYGTAALIPSFAVVVQAQACLEAFGKKALS